MDTVLVNPVLGTPPEQAPLVGPLRSTALVIDDSDRFRLALASLLRRAGFDVLEAVEGAQGMAIARATSVDLVITDIYMPGLGGLPTIEQLRHGDPRLTIIAMSGADAPVLDLAQRSAALGADWFLTKPFDAAELFAVIRRLRPGACAAPATR
jgi:two-component system chemotaxis response regulator CheY